MPVRLPHDKKRYQTPHWNAIFARLIRLNEGKFFWHKIHHRADATQMPKVVMINQPYGMLRQNHTGQHRGGEAFDRFPQGDLRYSTLFNCQVFCMQPYQRDFLAFAIQAGVLKFGQFTLKSGRISPYFFNAGLFSSGALLADLGRYYAQAIIHAKLSFDMMYGPAYKGIPLVAATTMALHDQHQRDVPYAFNRKEAKDHGEGGLLVGAELKGNILIIDDVISAGTSVRESIKIIRTLGATPAGIVIALDRQERGQGERSAIQEVEQSLGLAVASIVTLSDVIAYLTEKKDDQVTQILAYRQQYGC